MEIAAWCAQHNLPAPFHGRVPRETAIYFMMCLARRIRDLPTEVMFGLMLLTCRKIVEA
jgi:hypothetical protein